MNASEELRDYVDATAHAVANWVRLRVARLSYAALHWGSPQCS